MQTVTGPSTTNIETIETPIGTMTLVSNGAALIGLYTEEHKSRATFEPTGTSKDEVLRETKRQLAEYFDGSRQWFDLPLDPAGTDFEKRVWNELKRIPFGQTRTYQYLAASIGSPAAAHAVGGANARNPISIIVPCHRVIRTDGNLSGYAGGIPTKRWLLEHEIGKSVHM